MINDADDPILKALRKLQSRRHVRRTETGERRIVVLPPDGHGSAWAGSAR